MLVVGDGLVQEVAVVDMVVMEVMQQQVAIPEMV